MASKRQGVCAKGGESAAPRRPAQVSPAGREHPLDHLRVRQQEPSDQRMHRRLQAKLTVNQPRDIWEQESDRLAKAVLSPSAVKLTSISFSEAPAPIQRKCATDAEEDEENLQMHRRESPAAQQVATATAAIVTQVLNSLGQPLDRATRNFMESRFGHEFVEVRIHTDTAAAASARSAQAHAYTVGHDIVFAADHQQGSNSGRRLLAHELTHVTQQRIGLEPRIQRQMQAVELFSKTARMDYEKWCF